MNKMFRLLVLNFIIVNIIFAINPSILDAKNNKISQVPSLYSNFQDVVFKTFHEQTTDSLSSFNRYKRDALFRLDRKLMIKILKTYGATGKQNQFKMETTKISDPFLKKQLLQGARLKMGEMIDVASVSAVSTKTGNKIKNVYDPVETKGEESIGQTTTTKRSISKIKSSGAISNLGESVVHEHKKEEKKVRSLRSITDFLIKILYEEASNAYSKTLKEVEREKQRTEAMDKVKNVTAYLDAFREIVKHNQDHLAQSNNVGCIQNLCWKRCGPYLQSADWCFTTKDKIENNTKIIQKVPCKRDSDCNKFWACATSCNMKGGVINALNETISNSTTNHSF